MTPGFERAAVLGRRGGLKMGATPIGRLAFVRARPRAYCRLRLRNRNDASRLRVPRGSCVPRAALSRRERGEKEASRRSEARDAIANALKL
jgi:hypothetical protein